MTDPRRPLTNMDASPMLKIFNDGLTETANYMIREMDIARRFDNGEITWAKPEDGDEMTLKAVDPGAPYLKGIQDVVKRISAQVESGQVGALLVVEIPKGPDAEVILHDAGDIGPVRLIGYLEMLKLNQWQQCGFGDEDE